ncbi:hypothetical protein [uncultured Duncaniella sp.]|uniref:hypothetical protein n=1 Tax=uncultured Duncaniella sp. TaxID=2768039 RepID=UPI0025B6452C|nr:hypothetical protein [uncultured Duncaniella sp.]
MSAKPSLLELCRMQPRLAESTSAHISQKYSAATPMMPLSTGTPSEPASTTLARTAPFSSAYGNAPKAISESPI